MEGYRGRNLAYFLEARADIVIELDENRMSNRSVCYETMMILLDVSGGNKFGHNNSRARIKASCLWTLKTLSGAASDVGLVAFTVLGL